MCDCLIYLPGFTPLMYACESGDANIAKLLLENNASINCVVSGNLHFSFFYSQNHDQNKLSLIID